MKILQSLLILMFLAALIGCEKEDPCSGDEPSVEPAWVKEIQNEIENDPFICSADLWLIQLGDHYFIDKRVLVDSTWKVFYTLYDYDGRLMDDTGINSVIDREAADRIWYYFNPSCSWKSGMNMNCGQMESDSVKILSGRWKRTAGFIYGDFGGEDLNYPIGGGIVLEFMPTGEMALETYSNYYNVPVKNEGYYTLDSLLQFNFTDVELPFAYPLKWRYEFSYCNNSLKIATPDISGREDIYVRQE